MSMVILEKIKNFDSVLLLHVFPMKSISFPKKKDRGLTFFRGEVT